MLILQIKSNMTYTVNTCLHVMGAISICRLVFLIPINDDA